jgi:hypothetical protein
MQRLSMVFRGTYGSYLRASVHEGGASVVARLRAPQAQASLPPLYSPLLLKDSAPFFLTHIFNKLTMANVTENTK